MQIGDRVQNTRTGKRDKVKQVKPRNAANPAQDNVWVQYDGETEPSLDIEDDLVVV